MKSPRLARCALLVVALALVMVADGLSAAAATPGSVLWARRYNGPGDFFDGGVAVAVSPDGSTVFVTGYLSDSTTGYDYGTLAYDASTGGVQWTARYDGPTSTTDRAHAIAASSDGSTVFVTGYSESSTGRDYATVAYDAASGSTRWSKRYNSPANGDDEANALGVSSDSTTVFVTGYSDGSTSARDFATVAYDAATGGKAWVKRYNGPRDDGARSIAVSPDGSAVFVLGRSRGLTNGFDYLTVAYGADDGAKRWIRRYDWPSPDYRYPNDEDPVAVGVSPDSSRVFVTGTSVISDTNADYATIAYGAATGAKLWLRRHDGPDGFSDRASALAVSPDGSSVFVTGFDYTNQTGPDYATVAYDASTGTQLWVKRFVGQVRNDGEFVGTNEARDVVVSRDSSIVVVTGFTEDYDFVYRYATIAYDAVTGAKLWTKRYDNGGASSSNSVRALDVSESAVYVTGLSQDPSVFMYETDYATVAYALT
jgi:putative pyrroloquinoline-quinone binding quinoprotein